MCLCDKLLIKASNPKTHGLPWTKTFFTCPCVLSLDRKNVLCGPKWGRAWKPSPNAHLFLSTLPNAYLFLLLLPCILSCNKHNIHIKLLFSLMSSCNESTDSKVVLRPLKHSTFKIFPEFNSFMLSLLSPLWFKLLSSLIWDSTVLIPLLLSYSQFSKEQPEWSSKKCKSYSITLLLNTFQWISPI